jgi:hypothetical protein|tara:strand:+ start:2414 stop:3136 length:723 start_codon:yes stop_codon:yes gene_type:complete
MAEDVEGTVMTDNPDSSVEVQQEPVGEQYTVKVDGSEEQVSLDELRDGYQRQSDYTRKTQELASERSRLQQAEAIVQSLEADPAGTLEALGDAFGVDRAAAQPTVELDPWDEGPDPSEQRIANLEARLAQQDRVQRRQQVEKQVEHLKGSYGEFDATELYQHALKHKIGNLEAALTHMRYNEVATKANKLEQEQERTEAKRDAAVVEPSGSKQAGSSSAPVEQPSSIREAFMDAKRSLSS